MKDIPLLQIDGMLQLVEGDSLHICSAQPTTFLQATTTFNLATFYNQYRNSNARFSDISSWFTTQINHNNG